ncbi:response regulator [Streptomyces sp. NPDC004976]
MTAIRLLLVDDDPLVRAGLSFMLGGAEDIEIVGEAADGGEVEALVDRTRPDVVLMDIRMPLLDGIQATRQLAGPDTEGAPKVLVVTTFNVDAYVYDALRAGASGFLLKDAPPAELVNGIRTVARGEALLAPAITRHLIGHFAQHLRPADASRPARQDVVRALTPRELEVLQLIAEGLSNAEIAAAMFITPETVKTYVSRILAKLGLRDRVQAVVLAYRVGLVSP